MAANDSKSVISFLNKLVEQCNNTYHSINIKSVIDDYSVLTEKIETNFKAPKFRYHDRVRITKCQNIFGKGYSENWSREISIIDVLVFIINELILGLTKLKI